MAKGVISGRSRCLREAGLNSCVNLVLSAGSYQDCLDRTKRSKNHTHSCSQSQSFRDRRIGGREGGKKSVREGRKKRGEIAERTQPPSQAVSVPVHSRGSQYVWSWRRNMDGRCRKHEILERTACHWVTGSPPGKVRRLCGC